MSWKVLDARRQGFLIDSPKPWPARIVDDSCLLAAPANRAHTGPAQGVGDRAPRALSTRHRRHEENWMNFTISGHHLDITPALKEYVLTKLDRVTRHFDQVVDVSVLLSIENKKEKERRQKAEVTLHVKGRDIFVEDAQEDMYAAIDQVMDKLDRQVVRHKDKLQDHHHEASKRMDVSAM
jgi:putative sigma-54 modulation protein